MPLHPCRVQAAFEEIDAEAAGAGTNLGPDGAPVPSAQVCLAHEQPNDITSAMLHCRNAWGLNTCTCRWLPSEPARAVLGLHRVRRVCH